MPAAADTLYSKVVSRLEQECLSIQSTSIKNGPGSEYVHMAASTSAIKKSSKNPLGITCTNCKLDNHNFNHCWKLNGGAAGQWPGGPNDLNKSKLTSTTAISSTVPKPDLVAAILPDTLMDSSEFIVSTYPLDCDLSC